MKIVWMILEGPLGYELSELKIIALYLLYVFRMYMYNCIIGINFRTRHLIIELYMNIRIFSIDLNIFLSSSLYLKFFFSFIASH